MRSAAVQRHARPVHPAAERVVERHAVEQHERAADAARADAAQRHALRRRMRRQAAGAPEQAERRHLPQHVVGHHGRRAADVFLPEHGDAGRHVAQLLFHARCGHGDRFRQGCRREHDVDFGRRARRQRPFELRERRGAHDQDDFTWCGERQREPPIRPGDRLLFAAVDEARDDGGAGDHLAGRVADDAGDARRGRGIGRSGEASAAAPCRRRSFSAAPSQRPAPTGCRRS